MSCDNSYTGDKGQFVI